MEKIKFILVTLSVSSKSNKILRKGDTFLPGEVYDFEKQMKESEKKDKNGKVIGNYFAKPATDADKKAWEKYLSDSAPKKQLTKAQAARAKAEAEKK